MHEQEHTKIGDQQDVLILLAAGPNEVNVFAIQNGQLVYDAHTVNIVANGLLLREQVQVTLIEDLQASHVTFMLDWRLNSFWFCLFSALGL